MIKAIKRIFLSTISVLGISVFVWVLIALNPNWVYAYETKVEFVTIHHNNELEAGTTEILVEAIKIIKTSDLYHNRIRIDLCLNDESWFPKINPTVGKPMGYAMLDKTVLYNCKTNFKENLAITKWAINNYEFRKFDLAWLLAHEFTHNLQNKRDFGYVFKTTMGHINWKLEGHAEYISRQYKNDGKLNLKIRRLKQEENLEHSGLPVFELEDGTKQIFSYFKYALLIQYLMEEENLSFDEICQDSRDLDTVYEMMMEWNTSQKK